MHDVASSGLMGRVFSALLLLLIMEGTTDLVAGVSFLPAGKKRVLILHHGEPISSKSASAARQPTAFSEAVTHATTPGVNVERLARALEEGFTQKGCQVARKTPADLASFRDLLGYDAILIGSPVWFSNMSWPMKKLFDTYFFTIYEHHPGRLQGIVMSAFCTVMESGNSGPRALQAMQAGLEHLTDRVVPGLVIQTTMSEAQWRPLLHTFIEQIHNAFPQKP